MGSVPAMTAPDEPAAANRPAEVTIEEITFEEIARRPLPGMGYPVQWAFSPDGRVLTYLHDPSGGLDRRLYALRLPPEGEVAGPGHEVDLQTQAVAGRELSLDEQLRRERARELGVGVTSCTWAAAADALAVPLPGGVRVVRGLQAGDAPPQVEVVVRDDAAAGPPGGEVVAPRLSPDGSRLAFVREGDLHVLDLGTAQLRRLTHTAEEGLSNGLAEYVAQEEMDRADGLWWSEDSTLLAFAEVDERHVPEYRIVHQGSDEVGPAAEERHRYPFAGRANARVRLGVVPASGGEIRWMDLGDGDQYLARVHWLRGGGLVAEVESRAQDRLDVVALDPLTGTSSLLHREEGEPYVNLHDDFRELGDGQWLWSSERTGFRHLELRGAGGELVRVLTEGEWQVDRLEGVDEQRKVAFVTGTADGATERHLYEVPLAGGRLRRLSEGRGTHEVTVSPDGRWFVDRHASLGSPPTVKVRSTADGSVIAVLHDEVDGRIARLGLEPPEPVQVVADDGTVLHGLWYAPSLHGQDGTGPPPLVVQVYGGPHVQLAVDDWRPTVELRAQALRRHGIGVIVVDNRGSARRGLRFEAAIARRMGTLEVADQLAAVRWAVSSGLADPARVACYGWSYGGYMTLRLLELAPATFRAGVAGAPVTDWDGYDTHYTERYMGTPSSNPDGYEESSALTHAGSIEGALMLVHGLIDENVHFRHTARLIDRLVRARVRYELLCFPSERHLPRREEDRAFMEEQVVSWLVAQLGRAS